MYEAVSLYKSLEKSFGAFSVCHRQSVKVPYMSVSRFSRAKSSSDERVLEVVIGLESNFVNP